MALETSHYGFTDAPLLAATTPAVASLLGTNPTESPTAETIIEVITRFVSAIGRAQPTTVGELTKELDLAAPVA